MNTSTRFPPGFYLFLAPLGARNVRPSKLEQIARHCRWDSDEFPVIASCDCLGRGNNFECRHNSIASAVGSRRSYLGIPFVIGKGAPPVVRFRASLCSPGCPSRCFHVYPQLRAINRPPALPPWRLEIIAH